MGDVTAPVEENPKEHSPLRFSSPEPPPFLNPNWSGYI